MHGREAPLSFSALWAERAPEALVPRLLRRLAWMALALLAALGGLLVARRAGGALAEPLSPLVLWGAAVALASTALLLRAALVFPGAVTNAARRQPLPLSTLITLVLLAWAWGLSAPGGGDGLLGLWGVLLVEEGLSWHWLRQQAHTADKSDLRGPVTEPAAIAAQLALAEARPTAGATLADCDAPRADEREIAPPERDEEVTQQCTRCRLEDGREMLAGWFSAELAAGQRHATAHVAICPPLAGTLACYAEQNDGPEAEVRIAQVLPQGVRFEIKLDRPQGEASRVGIEFSIQQGAREASPQPPPT